MSDTGKNFASNGNAATLLEAETSEEVEDDPSLALGHYITTWRVRTQRAGPGAEILPLNLMTGTDGTLHPKSEVTRPYSVGN